jgi:hypothetical protein
LLNLLYIFIYLKHPNIIMYPFYISGRVFLLLLYFCYFSELLRKSNLLYFLFFSIYLFAVTPIWVKAKYIHSYKISEKKQADKRITTCTLVHVLLKFRLELWPMWIYFRNSNDCFIKSQTVGKSSNWGFRICWICILGWSVLKLGITLWKASIKLSLNILF